MTKKLLCYFVFGCLVSFASGGCSPPDNANPFQSEEKGTPAENPKSKANGPVSPAPEPEVGADQKDLKELEGEWIMVSGEQRGEQTPPEVVSGSLLTIQGDILAHTVVGVITLKGPFKIDPTQNPKWIDVTDLDGPTNGEKLIGIYELSGDVLKLYFSLPNKERPTDFSTQSGTGNILNMWKRKQQPTP